MKIVILDGYTENPGDLSWDELKQFGDVTIYDRTPYNDEEIIKRLYGADIAVTNKTPITKYTIESVPTLKFISVLATGYNVVDTAYAKEKGIPVSNVPTYGTDSVSQFAIALLLELCHHIGHHSDEVYKGRWEKNADWCFWDYPLIELAGKTLGIIGFGSIGSAVANIARAFGMKVIASTRTSKTAEGVTFMSTDEVFAKADFISLHCPLTNETRGLVNTEKLRLCKPTSYIINTSRGPVVNEHDLAKALNDGIIAGAGLDVVEVEPMRADNPLLGAKNCIITPHVAWAPVQTRKRLISAAADNLRSFINGTPKNKVN